MKDETLPRRMAVQECAGREDYTEVLERLAHSDFRARFRLGAKDRAYLLARDMAVVRAHARDFVARRLAPAEPAHDGRQTPMRGHPVFVAQHATASCCRSCLMRWHHIPKGRVLSAGEQRWIVGLLMAWIERQAGAVPVGTDVLLQGSLPLQGSLFPDDEV